MVLSCLALSGCEEKLDTLIIQAEPQLSVNALWDASEPTHRIYCSCVSRCEATPVEDAVIEISVNNQLIETVEHAEEDAPELYLATCPLRSGDRVRLKVTCPAFPQGVWAETVVPEPFVVPKAKAEVEYQSFYKQEAEPYHKATLSLEKRGEVASYGRILSGIWATYVYGKVVMDFADGTILEELADTLETDSVFEVKVLDDLCLTDGKGYVENSEDDMLGFNPVWQNHYHLFTDKYFSDGAYRMHYYVSQSRKPGFSLLSDDSHTINSRNHPLYGRRYTVLSASDDGRIKTILYSKAEEYALFYEVHSLTEAEYYYLQTLSTERDLADTNMAYTKPLFLTQNVQGGLGFFAIESVVRGRISLD